MQSVPTSMARRGKNADRKALRSGETMSDSCRHMDACSFQLILAYGSEW